jgi:hypothetical protein
MCPAHGASCNQNDYRDNANRIISACLSANPVLGSDGVLCVADIRTALKGKDEDYVKLLKRQAADVDTMLSAMGQQLGQMTAAYREELENVERVLLQVSRSC